MRVQPGRDLLGEGDIGFEPDLGSQRFRGSLIDRGEQSALLREVAVEQGAGNAFFAYGTLCVWAARDLERNAGLIHLLMAVFFVGGLVRLMTVAYVGWPHWFYIAMMVVEIVTPLVVSPLLQRVTGRTAHADLIELAR